MDDDIRAELERLKDYATASGQPFEEIAAEMIVNYQRSLRTTRRALADIRDHQHFAKYPLAPVAL